MHWSKTRHTDFEACPRRFFYGAIAAVHNEHFAVLRDRDAPPLMRHEAVRNTISAVLELADEDAIENSVKAGIQTAYDTLIAKFDDVVANHEISIVESSIRTFVNDIHPDLGDLDLIHNANAQPVEFEYGALRMMASPELVYRTPDHIWVISWKTGKSAFFDQADASLKCAAATFWIRSQLEIVDARVVHSDIYLSESGNRKDTELDDQSLSAYLDEARRVAAEYSRSAKIREPSQAGIRNLPILQFPICVPRVSRNK